MNKVIICGNMTRKAELRTTPSGQKVANFSIAVGEKYKDKQGQWVENTEFVNCVAWGRTAEVIEQYLDKGSKVLCEGKMKTSSWDKEGEKRYKTEVIVSNMEMLGSKSQGQQAPSNAPQNQSYDSPPSYQSQEGSDLPF